MFLLKGCRFHFCVHTFAISKTARLLSSVCFIVHVLQVYSSYIILNFRVCSGYLQEFLIAFNIVISIKPNALWSAQGCPPPKWNQSKPDFFPFFLSFVYAPNAICSIFSFIKPLSLYSMIGLFMLSIFLLLENMKLRKKSMYEMYYSTQFLL